MEGKERVLDLLNNNNTLELIIMYTHEVDPDIPSDKLTGLTSLVHGNVMMYNHAYQVASSYLMNKYGIKSVKDKQGNIIKFY